MTEHQRKMLAEAVRAHADTCCAHARQAPMYPLHDLLRAEAARWRAFADAIEPRTVDLRRD